MELNQEVEEVFFKCFNVNEKAAIIEVCPRYLPLVVRGPSCVSIVPLTQVGFEAPRVLQHQKFGCGSAVLIFQLKDIQKSVSV
jgi:hypothetical protein